MKLFGMEIGRIKAPSFRGQLRADNAQGPYSKYFRNWVAKKVDADFYETLREAIPIIDAAIWKLVALDGHMYLEGNNQALIDEISDWMDNVQVNDMKRGLQAFHHNLSNEAFEQGFGLGEFITDKKRTDIIRLRVADSKTIKFARGEQGIEIYQKVTNDLDYRPLTTDNLLYFSIHDENQSPYGTSIMRSLEFVSKILATMHNSLLNIWERFGDPSFQVTYKATKRSLGSDTLEKRRQAISDEFDVAIRDKRAGKSMDFVSAIDKDSDMEIKVIGGQGETLEFQVPARHVLEQMVAKFGLPPWMLGLQWSTTERMADKEVTMLLQEVTSRQASKKPFFSRLIRNLLILRGRTWKKGDWEIKFRTANLHDIEKQARARFLNAQADMYYFNAGFTPEDIPENRKDWKIIGGRGDLAVTCGDKKETTCGCKAEKHIASCKEEFRPWDWPELDRVEHEYEQELLYEWAELEKMTMTILKLQAPKTAKQDLPGVEAFTYSEEQRAMILKSLDDFVGRFDIKDKDSAIKWYYGQAYSLGLIQAAKMIGKEKPILSVLLNEEVVQKLYTDGFKLLKNRATVDIVDKILPEIDAFVIAGVNPKQVAGRLKILFDKANADWERLARSEIAMAAERAKLDEWEQWKVKMVEFTPAPDACPICMALKGVYKIEDIPVPVEDTHPRCRCSTRPAESEA